MAYNKRVPVNITLSKKLVKKIKEYKKIHPEFNLSRYIESQLLFTKTFTPIKFTS